MMPPGRFLSVVDVVVLLLGLLCCGSVRGGVPAAEYSCFQNRTELGGAIQRFTTLVHPAEKNDSDVALRYGWPIGTWCVGRVTNFDGIFRRCPKLAPEDRDLNSWDTSRVTSMEGTFANSAFFDGDISDWNTSLVTSMLDIFRAARRFDGDLSSWDTGRVTSMRNAFFDARSFGRRGRRRENSNNNNNGTSDNNGGAAGGLSKWNVSSVVDMGAMFAFTESFASENLNEWDTSRVTDLSNVFAHSNFRGDVSRWDTSRVTDMGGCFRGARLFNDENLSGWQTSRVTDMSFMFFGASSFTGGGIGLSNWDTSRVRRFRYAFAYASSFDGDVSRWNASSAESLWGMFSGAKKFRGAANGGVSAWDVSRVRNAAGMFSGAASFAEDLCSWGGRLPRDAAAEGMFASSGCPNQEDPDLSSAVAVPGPFCHDCIV